MDMRLLTVFDEVYKTRSVSKAADNLDLAQTSVSLALARLRRQFNDPLFVRTSEGMVPTPHAQQLVQPLRDALELLRRATRQQVLFEPKVSTRAFKISMTDISNIEFLPGLMHRLEALAPSVHIQILRIAPDTPKLLESGESDLALGYMPELEAGFYQQRLFEQGFVCVVRKDHPKVGGRMTTKVYADGRHVAITAPGTGHSLAEEALGKLHVTRRVALSLPTLPGLGNLIENTDLIATIPESVASTLIRIARVKIVLATFDLPRFSIKQHWHERYHHDPANQWLRSVIAELFLK
jgi:DNA-binding transcriptional LysR family regulator